MNLFTILMSLNLNDNNLKVKGYQVALLEILLFGLGAYAAQQYLTPLQAMGGLMYYWFCFTTLTGYWESVYIRTYDEIASFAQKLVENKQSVWTMDVPLYYVCPYYLAKLFYAEYGANADREYMSERKGDYWSRLIESSHATCCGLFACGSLVTLLATQSLAAATIVGMMGMGCQFMNSLLYMGEYFLQCNDKDSPNYCRPSFPLGRWMADRLFMWINLFWLLFPFLICAGALLDLPEY